MLDWLRLQKALSVEAERGFNDLIGSQYRFSEFLNLSLNQPLPTLPRAERQRLKQMADEFSRYADLSFAQRQHLVAETRRVLYSTRRLLEEQAVGQQGGAKEQEDGKNEGQSSALEKRLRPKVTPKTTALIEKTTESRSNSIRPSPICRALEPKIAKSWRSWAYTPSGICSTTIRATISIMLVR